jgi:hypothetical protein
VVVGSGDRSSPWDIDGGRLRWPAHGQQVAFIAGRLPAFTTKGRARHNSPIRRRTSVGALERGARATNRGALGAVTTWYEDAVRAPRMPAQRGAGDSCFKAVETGPAQTPRRHSGLRAARGAAKPTGRPTRRRCSRARPSCISAGQRDFDRTFLQNIELCDKNGRYKSCR